MISNKVYQFKYSLGNELRKNLYSEIVGLHNSFFYGEYNNNLCLNGWFADHLHEIFVNKCREIYGPFNVLDIPRNATAWCYLNNKDWYRGENIHSHIGTATYVGVYYLNVPKTKDKQDSGFLKFFNHALEVVDCFYPKTGNFLIFESDLIHSISKCESKQFRISINLELLVSKKIEIISLK